MGMRTATLERKTRETDIVGKLTLDGSREIQVTTGIGFLDHMVTALAFHAGWDLQLRCEGDLEIDDHHSAEDCAIVLGKLLEESVGDRSGIKRFGSAYAPLDEALARCVVDVSGRPFASVELGFRREMIGQLATENMTHFWQTLATNAGVTLHLDLIRGDNDHHKAEAGAKAAALAFRDALAATDDDVASTKGVL